MPLIINYKKETEHHRDIKLEANGDLTVICQEINLPRSTELMVLLHNTTARDINHLIYALEQMKTFVPKK